MSDQQSRSENPLEGTVSELAAGLPIGELKLSVRCCNALRAHRIRTLGQLAALSDEDLLKFHGLGRRGLAEVRQAIDEFGRGLNAESSPSGGGEQRGTLQSHRSIEVIRSRFSSGGWKMPRHNTGKLSAPVEVLDLSARSLNVLTRLRIRSVRRLLAYPKEELIEAKNMGRRSLSEIETKLFAYLSSQAREPGGAAQPSRENPTKEVVGTKAFVDQVLSRLPERQRSVLADRYGLWDGIAETLQDIGDKLGVTRERIRQIESSGLKRLRRVFGHGTIRDFVLQAISAHVQGGYGILNEDEAAGILASDCSLEQAALAVGFLQDIEAPGERLFARHFIEVEPDVYCLGKASAADYGVLLELIELALQRRQRPLSEQELYEDMDVQSGKALSEKQLLLLRRVFEVSPSVVRLRDGTIASSRWTEFRRRDATNLAEATLRMLGKPAHFREIAERIARFFPDAGTANERTIHNALVRSDKKFVWVKNGTYGLAAWGLKKPPFIKDRLIEVLSEARYPLPFWHLKEKVLAVCNCKDDSVRMTLDLNPKVFRKFEGDQYGLRKHYDE